MSFGIIHSRLFLYSGSCSTLFYANNRKEVIKSVLFFSYFETVLRTVSLKRASLQDMRSSANADSKANLANEQLPR